MKLTDEERNSLVVLQMEKAKTFLKQADEMYEMKYWDIASIDIIMLASMLFKLY